MSYIFNETFYSYRTGEYEFNSATILVVLPRNFFNDEISFVAVVEKKLAVANADITRGRLPF